MDIVVFKELDDGLSDLALEIVNYDECCLVFSDILPGLPKVWHNYVFDVVKHHALV